MLISIYEHFKNNPNLRINSFGLNTVNSLCSVKKKKGVINCYLISYGDIINHSQNPYEVGTNVGNRTNKEDNPILTLRKDYYSLSNSNSNSWLPQRLAYFRIIRNVKINWVRGKWICTFSDGTKMVCYPNMKINYDGTPYESQHPKKYVKEYEEHKETIGMRANAVRRSWYHNKKAVERLNAAYDYDTKENNLHKVPMDDVFKLRNVSHRRLLIEHYGMDKIIDSCKNETIDEDLIGDNPYKLVKVHIPDNFENNGVRVGNYLRMVNPSTGEIHFEGVPNILNSWSASLSTTKEIPIKTVKQALAWRNGNNNLIYNKPLAIT